ncbi:MAG TPA: D-alanyl-D-alanine carboxypeptidase [Cyclobacteriaceae bacterium]|nr:D-alanyl-D-alanine carboxypeptidase [Cyclobacteriaceae bacterium]
MVRYCIILVGLIAACSPVSKTALNKKFKSLEERLQDHSGFMLYDLQKKKPLYEFQSNRYFTPASNTKTFTFYTALVLLGDSIPALQYLERGDSLIFRGTGDPSFLYSKAFDSRKVFDFLKLTDKQLFLVEDNFFTEPLGTGWAWDDYYYRYSSERSAFPIYGNFLTGEYNGQSLKVNPAFFAYQVSVSDSTEDSKIERDLGSNKIKFNPGKLNQKKKWEVPFRTSTSITAQLLSDTLRKKVQILDQVVWDSVRTLFSIPVDSIYKPIMQPSDNFAAEQVLMICANVLSDSLKPEIAINYMKKNYLNDLPDKPLWVDGSGLSRFNLFTPRSMVRLWEKIYERIPQERLFSIIAVGGKTGTLKNAYKNERPYIYGKSGTLSNNHNVSGFIVTKKGRILIFSFMNNNHPANSSTVRNEMEKLLKSLYEHY